MFFFENLVFLCFVIPSFSKSTSTTQEKKVIEWTPHETLPLPGLDLDWEAMRSPSNQTLYVDKTRFVQYLGKVNKLMFLTRPRRFGKTTFLDMVRNLYQNNQTLFKDLYVYQYGNVEWIRHRLRHDKQGIKDKWLEFPVIHLDFSEVMEFTTYEKYLEELQTILCKVAEDYDVIHYVQENISIGKLIHRLQKKFELPVILLIDEYDSPFHRAKFDLENEQLTDQVIKHYKGFYSEIKSNVGKLAFALVTGASCLAIQSLQTGPNSFNDYTYSKEMATAFGLTRTEIETNFGYHIYEFAKWRASQRVQGPKKEREPNPEDITLIYDELINWYDGYHFDMYCESETVLNVVSTITALEKKVIGNHWSDTASMLPIIKQFYKHHRSLKDYEKGKRMSKGDLEKRVSPKMTKLPTNKMLLSYGYMAIKKFDKTKLNKEIFIEFANEEIKDAIETHLADFDLGTQDFISELPTEGTDLRNCFNLQVNIEHAMELLNIFELESYNSYYEVDGTLNTDEMPRRLQQVFKHYETTTELNVPFFKEDLSGPAGDIDLLTTDLEINVAAEIKCTKEKTSVAAINQLIGYYENHRTPFMEALGNPEVISFLGLHYEIVDDKKNPDLILKDWIYLPYYDGKLQIEHMQFSSSSNRKIFFNTRKKKSTHTLVDDSRGSTAIGETVARFPATREIRKKATAVFSNRRSTATGETFSSFSATRGIRKKSTAVLSNRRSTAIGGTFASFPATRGIRKKATAGINIDKFMFDRKRQTDVHSITRTLVPAYLPGPPEEILKVKYPSNLNYNSDNMMQYDQVEPKPDLIWTCEPNEVYTLIVTFLRMTTHNQVVIDNTNYRSSFAWFVINIPGCNIDKGAVIFEYRLLRPCPEIEDQYLIYSVFKQPVRNISEPLLMGRTRSDFNINEFAHDNGITNPLAANMIYICC